MSTEKIKLRNVKVEYVKGKYSYKQRMNSIDTSTCKIELSGPISGFKEGTIDNLYDVERNKGRLNKESRDILKGLQMNLSNPKIIESKGVTHIIVYECLNK